MDILNYTTIKPEIVDVDTYMQHLDFCQHNDFMVEIKPIWARRLGYLYCKYMVQRTDNYIEIRYFYDEPKRIRLYTKSYCAEHDEKITGYEAFLTVEDKWQRDTNNTISIFKAFSGSKYRDIYRKIKECVPEQIAFIDNDTGKVFNNCYKADKSSAFPSQLIKDIPTLHDCKTINGYAEPTEDFPFAFYLNSKHIKIYNELDTRDLNNFYYKSQYNKKYNDSVKPEDEITILCKKSEYSFKQTFLDLYNHRNENPDNKLYMNAFIGFCHRNGDPRLSHIAAVVLARNNCDMINKCKYLEAEGNLPIYIATDSIVWIGHNSDICTSEKYIGSFTFEGKGKFFGRQIGSYQFLKDDGELINKCSYIKNGEEKENITFGKLPESKKSKIIVDSKYRVIQLL